MSFRAHQPIELDFFKMEEENTKKKKSQFKKLMKQTSFRGIQKLNPQLLKSVINSGGGGGGGQDYLERKSPAEVLLLSPLQPVVNHPIPTLSSETTVAPTENTKSPTTAGPLTIIYNGTVSVFDVPSDKVDTLMKLADQNNRDTTTTFSSGGGKTLVVDDDKSKQQEISSSSSSQGQILLERLNGDLPISRKKSLQRFLEKRKERLVFASPYASGLGTTMEKSRETTIQLS